MKYKHLSILLYSFMISALIFLLIPLNLVANNVSDFAGFSYSEYFSYSLLLLGASTVLIFLISALINRISAKVNFKILTAIFGYLVICGFYLSIRSGLMDGAQTPQLSYLSLSLILAIVLVGTIFFEKKFRLLMWFALVGGIVSMLIGLNKLTTESQTDIFKTHFFNVSTNKKNIFLISFDGLQADQVETVLNSNPQLKKEFDGFINFKNATAVAPFTELSTLTTKFGYTPNTDKDTKIIAQNNAKNFITNFLKKNNYQVSTYSSLSITEELNRGILAIPRYNIASKKVDFYLVSFTASFQRYLPYHLNPITHHNNIIYSWIKTLLIKTPEENTLPEAIIGDSYHKVDLRQYNYFIEHLKPFALNNTAHLHHYIFSHYPVVFDPNCNYREANTVPQNYAGALEETECSIKKFIQFLQKLKALKAFDNSLIVFASDHGQECNFNPPSSPIRFHVSKRWCLSRYTPLLMIKPFYSNKSFSTNDFEASLIDIAKTICMATTNNLKACEVYEGVNLLAIQPNDKFKKRNILVINSSSDWDARDYSDFHAVDIGRSKTIFDFFHLNQP